MKTTLRYLTLLAPLAALAACAGMPSTAENAKPYTCAEYNTARAHLTALPTGTTLNDLYQNPEILRFMKVNYVGFKAALPKHPGTRTETMALIDDTVDLQAIQCRTAPTATVNYTAQQVTPASVLLGYSVSYASAAPAEATAAEAQRRMGQPLANESGMASVKAFIQNCASGSGPALACKLGNL